MSPFSGCEDVATQAGTKSGKLRFAGLGLWPASTIAPPLGIGRLLYDRSIWWRPRNSDILLFGDGEELGHFVGEEGER